MHDTFLVSPSSASRQMGRGQETNSKPAPAPKKRTSSVPGTHCMTRMISFDGPVLRPYIHTSTFNAPLPHCPSRPLRNLPSMATGNQTSPSPSSAPRTPTSPSRSPRHPYRHSPKPSPPPLGHTLSSTDLGSFPWYPSRLLKPLPVHWA